jgi:hypothetical protein
MSKWALLFLLAATPAAVAAQDARIYTPDTPKGPGEMTILNTSIVKVDGPGRMITVRVDAGRDGDVDRNRTRQLTVAPSAAASLATLKAGSEVLLTLRGDTVVAIKMSAGGGGGSAPAARQRRPPTARGTTSAPPVTLAPAGETGPSGAAPRVIVVSPAPPAAGGPQERIPQLPPGATSPANRGVPQLPAGVDPPQGRPVPQVAPAGGVIVITGSPAPGISPAGVAPTRPAVSPVAVGSPKSPGTPRPVVLPSDAPPTPMPSPVP